MGRSKGRITADGGPDETQIDGIQAEDTGAEVKKRREKKKKEKRKPKSNGDSRVPKPDKAASKGSPSTISEPTPLLSKKRKRNHAIDEIEIDIDAPEPPSKKALRKLKKSGTAPTTITPVLTATPPSDNATKINPKSAKPETYPEHSSQSRSKWGIWIGNLTFATRKPDLEEFFTAEPSPVARLDVTRINLPTNPQTGNNKGFAYVDFATEAALDYALSLSEKLWNGRRVLIKNAKDFSSRNSSASAAPALGANLSKNPPSKILFVGNLDFSATEADLLEHFAFAGKIAKVRLTTFEDTGKCKGFGFVDFEDEESVKRAMLGLSVEDEEKLKTLEGKEELGLEKLKKKRGTIGSRKIKMEYGEDPSVRYKKRFGKDKEEPSESKGAPPLPAHLMGSRGKLATGGEERPVKKTKPDRPRPAKLGAAYSDDIRRIGAITESRGKRVRFQL